MYGNESQDIPESGNATAPRLLYSIPEVAHALGGITERYVSNLIREQKIRSVKVGRRRLVPAAALAEYIAGLEKAQAS